MDQLSDWVSQNQPAENLIFKEGLWDQVKFVRDRLTSALADNHNSSYDEWRKFRDEIRVINTHTSKSVMLPVYFIEWKDFQFVLRYNFYDWKVSVKSPHNLPVDFNKLFDTHKTWAYYYCEGFPKDRVYGSFEENSQEFTAAIHNNYDLYVFFWLIGNCQKC